MKAISLSSEDSASLQAVVDAPSSSQALALRARIVLRLENESAGAVAKEFGVSRNTVVKWLERFGAFGLSGLDDRHRPGRPASIGDEEHRAVVAVQLERPEGGTWTTRAVADRLSISQSAVSRVRRRWFTEPRGLITRSVLPSLNRYVVAGVLISATACALVLHETSDADGVGPQPNSRRAPHEAVRTVLSAQFMTFAERSESEGRSALLDMLARVERVTPSNRKLVTLTDVSISADLRRWSHRHPRCSFYEVAPARWLAQLEPIADAIDRRQTAQLRDLEGRLRDWVANGADDAFAWVRPPRLAQSSLVPDRAEIRSASTRLATAVVHSLRESIATGAFPAGQRIAEAPLAERLGVSRGPIRDALQILAEDGLLALEPHRGAYIPIPTYQDIFDTYTARAPLGALLLRRLATRRDADMAPVEAALSEVARFAAAGDAPGAGHADIQWQDALAVAAGMPRIEKLFVRLSLQLRMFVSILAIDYTYAVDDIVLDDRAIFDALVRHDADLATTLWTRKIDNAVHNMVEQYRRLQGDGSTE